MGDPRVLKVAVGCVLPHALQLKLTPGLKAALYKAAERDEQASIEFSNSGAEAVVRVGSAAHQFRVISEQDRICRAVSVDQTNGECIVAGNITEKLHPVPRQSKTTQRITGSVLSAASQAGSLRSVLLAILAERPTSLHGIKSSLQALVEMVPNFKLPSAKGEVEQTLRTIAEYKSPGVYSLKASIHESEKTLSKLPPHGVAPLPVWEKRGSPEPGQPPSPGARTRCTPSLLSEDRPSSLSGHHPGLSLPLSSSSRGAIDSDESWVIQYAERDPLPPPEIITHEEYLAAEIEFLRKYDAYFRLHQLLTANRRDFEALQRDMDAADNACERRRLENEVRCLWARRGDRSRSWESAFRVLDQEIKIWKAILQESAHRDDGGALKDVPPDTTPLLSPS